jgi:phospholipid-binding lipoprotein MlaA
VRPGALPVALALACFAAGARAAVPVDIEARIAEAAQQGRELSSSAAVTAARIGDPTIGQMLTARAREQAGNTLSAVVIGGIAQNPALAGEIVASAQAAAPEIAQDVTRQVAQAYPFLGVQPSAPSAPVARPAAPAPRATAPASRPQPVEPEGPPPATDKLPEVTYDPLEDVNRGIFAFNDVFDRFLLRPIAWTYGEILPGRIKTSVRNFFRNLGSPVRFANDALQGTANDAATTFARFLINSTVGVGGLFEVAEDWGFEHKPSDFGTTLHGYGVNAGPYLVVPFLGPTNARDAVGLIVDSALNPLTWLADTTTNAAILGGRIVSTREHLIEPLDEMRKGSLDYYAALRSAYYQDRATDLRKGVPVLEHDLDKDFDAAQ